MRKTFVIGDTHFPFHNPEAYTNLLKHLEVEKPEVVVQIGDLLDQYVFSKYSRSLEITPGEEILRGLQCAKQLWKDVRRICGVKVQCYQILGNHDVRVCKRISDRLPELYGVFNPLEIYDFDGVVTLESDRDYLNVDGVIYTHGWLSDSIGHARFFNMPTVHGHTHRPGITTDGPTLWSMDVGFMADESSLPLSYSISKWSKWRMSAGVVDKNCQPRLIFLNIPPIGELNRKATVKRKKAK